MSLLSLEQKVAGAAEHLKTEAEALLAKAHAEIDHLLGVEKKDESKLDNVVNDLHQATAAIATDATAAADTVKETEGEISTEVK